MLTQASIVTCFLFFLEVFAQNPFPNTYGGCTAGFGYLLPGSTQYYAPGDTGDFNIPLVGGNPTVRKYSLYTYLKLVVLT
jgi:hypothetical protein